MDMKRAKELIKELTVLVDQIDDLKISEFNNEMKIALNKISNLFPNKEE